jgi:phosphate transport system protein
MSNHIMHAFDNDLKELNAKVAEMGFAVADMIARANKALMTTDIELAKQVRLDDKKIDAMQREIEEKGTLTIAKRQPMANDLRVIIGTFRVANDLERMADLAKNIAKRVITIDKSGEVMPRVPMGFETLSRMAKERLEAVLEAYAKNDLVAAKQVWDTDDDIDAGYSSLFRELLTYMVENPKNITACAHLLFCAKNIERMGDHATNIAESVWYATKGEVLGA